MTPKPRSLRTAKPPPNWGGPLVMLAYLRAHRLPLPVVEHRFHPTRRWRWDYAWPDQMVALEIDGGVWTQGKHGRGAGIIKDHEKRNAAAALGWRLLLATPSTIHLCLPALGDALRWRPTESGS